MAENALANQTANKSKQDAVPIKDKTDFRNLDPKQKAAIVVASLGADRASQTYKYLDEQDIEDLTYEMVKMGKTTNSQMEGALDEFYRLYLTHKMTTGGGLDYARNVLEKAFGETTVRSLLEKVSKTLQPRSLNFFMKGDPKALLSPLWHERSRVIALIMSYMDPEQAVRMLEQLPESRRILTVEGMVKIDRASPEAIVIVEEKMKRRFVTIITSEDNMNLGGVDYMVDVMNHVDRSNEKRTFDGLDKRNSELFKGTRDKMFVFENILDVDDRSVQCFICDCDAKDIVHALKSASDEMQQILFTNMSKRMAGTVRADLEITTNVRTKNVEETQQRIVNIIRHLEDAGKVIINKGEEDDNIFIQRHRPSR